MVGTTVSHYKVLDKLSQGVMGEVYRAEDTNLSRQIAINALLDGFAHDAERLARSEREARLLASSNRANIAAIHGLEEHQGKWFLVLELVEGQTLAGRSKKGRIPLDETLDICRQIAEGLDAAHEKVACDSRFPRVHTHLQVEPEGEVHDSPSNDAEANQTESEEDIALKPGASARSGGAAERSPEAAAAGSPPVLWTADELPEYGVVLLCRTQDLEEAAQPPDPWEDAELA